MNESYTQLALAAEIHHYGNPETGDRYVKNHQKAHALIDTLLHTRLGTDPGRTGVDVTEREP